MHSKIAHFTMGNATWRFFMMLTFVLSCCCATAFADDATTLTKDTDGYYLITSGEDLQE